MPEVIGRQTASGGATSHPQQIGPFEILQVLGEGGMGIVYEAEEMAPVRRRVALKVVRRGHDSVEVLRRFDVERRALAVMNHPGIAKVLSAGSTSDGQPYFAMELVRGQPITTYADYRRLSVRDRLQLFIAVCHAVQHAHQKGVIHRDLKPSNVLVTEEDGVPQPKVIDFGIAKALGPQSEDALLTMGGQAVGTAAYMSPEQADPAADVDTRSDIYSLGVMLYELLVGHLPVDPAEMGIHHFLARLATTEITAPVPSVRLTTAGDGQNKRLAHLRRTDTAQLRRAVRGDLDWVVMKAMHPDRQQRYETANALAADLRRHLDDEPVAARPPSARYRVSKFVRRHRMGVLASSIVIVAVTVSAVVATVGFVRASRAERVAAQEAEAAKQVTDFLVDLFRVSDPGESRGSTLTAREILDRGSRRVATDLSGQPLLQARVMQTIGTVHAALGEYEPARALLEGVLRTRERELGLDDPAVGETLNALGDVARARGDQEAADAYFRRALAIREAAYGPNHITVATTLGMLAALRFQQGRAAAAESLYLRVLPLDRRVRKANDPRTARDMRGLAAVYWSQQRYAQAESLWKETLALQERTLGSDHPDVGATLNNLGTVNYSTGHYAQALPYYRRALPILERALGPSHPTVASVLNNLAEVNWKLHNFAAADSLFRRALAVKEQTLAPQNPSIAVTLNGLAGLRRDEGRYAEAEPLYRRALAIREKALGPTHSDVVETLKDYALMLRRAGRTVEAAEMERRAGLR